jgi:hypothetical protein
MLGIRQIVTNPLMPPSIVPLADLKAHLGIAPADISQDARVVGWGAAAIHAMELYCDRILVERTVVELLAPENGTTFAVLSGTNVSNVAQVLDRTQDPGALIPAIEYTSSNGGILARKGTAWPASIEVTYTAGFSLAMMPPLLLLAAKEWTKNQHSAANLNPLIAAESSPEVGSVTYVTGAASAASTGGTASDMPPAIARLLIPFKRRYA